MRKAFAILVLLKLQTMQHRNAERRKTRSIHLQIGRWQKTCDRLPSGTVLPPEISRKHRQLLERLRQANSQTIATPSPTYPFPLTSVDANSYRVPA